MLPVEHIFSNHYYNKEKHRSKKQQNNNSMKIFNLLTHVLTEAEESLLNKTNTDDFHLFLDLNNFVRKVTLTRFFLSRMIAIPFKTIPMIRLIRKTLVKF